MGPYIFACTHILHIRPFWGTMEYGVYCFPKASTAFFSKQQFAEIYLKHTMLINTDVLGNADGSSGQVFGVLVWGLEFDSWHPCEGGRKTNCTKLSPGMRMHSMMYTHHVHIIKQQINTSATYWGKNLAKREREIGKEEDHQELKAYF